MRRSRDLQGAGSTVNGALRRRQRVATLRDSSDEVEQMMVLKGTVRLRDRERLRKKERGRDLSKRRRIENRSVVQQRSGGGVGGCGGGSYRESVNLDSSDEDCFEEGVETRIHQQNMTTQLPPSPNHREGSVDRGKVGSPEERESPSFVKVDACDNQYPTVTKADYEDGTKKSSRIEIDLMALPSLPSSPERDITVDINSETMAQDVQKALQSLSIVVFIHCFILVYFYVICLRPLYLLILVQKKSETSPSGSTEALSSNQSLNLNLEQQRHDTSSASKSTAQLQQNLKEPKNQCSWPGVLPHAGYVPSHRADLPRSSLTMQAPEFKFLQPRPKRCATHRYIAENIHYHNQLVQKSLSSGLTGVGTTLYGTKSSNIKSIPEKNLTGDTGEDKSSRVSADFNVRSSAKSLLQQAPSQAQAQARNFLHNPVFTFPLGGHHQAAIMAPPNSLTNKPPATSSHVETSNAGTFNRSFFPSNEATSSYIAMLQNNGYQFPIPPNIALPPSFKSGSILNSSLYSLPVSKTDANKTPQMERKNGASASNDSAAQIYSFSVQPMSCGHTSNKLPPVSQNSSAIFQKLPEPSWNGYNKNFPSSDEKSRNVGIPPSHLSLVPIPTFQHQVHPKASSFQTDYSPLTSKWDNFSRTAKVPEGSFQFFAQHIPQTKVPEGSQRLSPACRRNVPSILCNGGASQLPELKH
ncbi:hypothetical protein STAS_00372 [Striga asiatica]|uniref:Time for coffee n=1 Tax=Striga asiatica TaxID=4170 RepID=A0A5A7NWH8_STRAF|nr:hypothetical protein STAS_00372 [Striga asiatica]